MRAHLTTICSADAQEEIRAFLSRYLHSLPRSESEKNQIILAADEAIANAIIHGNQADETRSLQVDIDVSEKRIMIEIYDIGLIDIKATEEKKQKDLKDIIKDRQKGGLGLKLIYSIMDIVTFYTRENKSYCMMIKLFR